MNHSDPTIIAESPAMFLAHFTDDGTEVWVYTSPIVSETGQLFAPVAQVIEDMTLIEDRTEPAEYMMFGEVRIRRYLAHDRCAVCDHSAELHASLPSNHQFAE